jgi:hypothetical protein
MYKEIFEDIISYEENFVAIIGYSDLVNNDFTIGLNYIFKDLKEDDFWIILGRADSKSILDELKNSEFSLEREGEYEFKMLLKYYTGDWSVGESGYYEIVYEEFNFIQTFLERERDQKLNSFFDDDIFNI